MKEWSLCVVLQAILETEFASSSSQNKHLQQQLEAVERNRTDLEASWLHNRRLNHAARVIQRRYRLWRSRNHVAKFGRDAEVSQQPCVLAIKSCVVVSANNGCCCNCCNGFLSSSLSGVLRFVGSVEQLLSCFGGGLTWSWHRGGSCRLL